MIIHKQPNAGVEARVREGWLEFGTEWKGTGTRGSLVDGIPGGLPLRTIS